MRWLEHSPAVCSPIRWIGEPFAALCASLKCSEVNSSFRRVHKSATWDRWAASVPGDFRFSVKMPKTITHDARLKCCAELVIEFFQQIRSLNDRSGRVLVQTPPSWDSKADMSASIRRLIPDPPLSITSPALQPRLACDLPRRVDSQLERSLGVQNPSECRGAKERLISGKLAADSVCPDVFQVGNSETRAKRISLVWSHWLRII